MTARILTPYWKAVLIGGLSGALVFSILSAVRAQSQMNVADVLTNPQLYIGKSVQVTGIAKDIRAVTYKVNGSKVPTTKLNLYEVDAKGRKGRHYINVAIPTSSFSSVPADGQMASITGLLKGPYEVGVIEP